MAKALHGFMSSVDPYEFARLTAENRRLRQRVLELESHVLRLQSENDALVAAAAERIETLDASMQPA